VIIVLILAVIMLLLLAAGFITDWMWFSELGYVSVFFKKLTTQFLMGIPIFAAVLVITNLYLRSIKQKYFSRIESRHEPDRKKLSRGTNIASGVFALTVAVMAVQALWFDWLQFINATPFDLKDPLFNHDVSFYVFRLDFFKSLNGLLISTVLLFMLLTTGYYLVLIVLRRPVFFEEVVDEGPVEPETDTQSVFHETPIGQKLDDLKEKFGGSIPGVKTSRRLAKGNLGELFMTAKTQLMILAVAFFLLLAFDFTLRQYDLLNSHTGVVYGAGYTSVTVILWSFRILTVLAVLGAVLTVVFLKKKMFKRLALIPLTMALVAGLGILSAILVQNYIVSPDELNKEQEYLKRNIEFTQYAYRLNDVSIKDFAAEANLDAQAINDNSQTISNIRINDYEPVRTFYNQTQSIRQYYKFNDVDNDRYRINGELTQTYLAVREIDESRISNTWMNSHIKYTHGYGVTLSRVDTVTASGQPDVLIKNIPPKSSVKEIDIKQPRVYFGELTNNYSLVNTSEDEFDYPDGDKNKYTRYDGKAGIKLGLFQRIMFAVRERSLKLLVSTNIKSDSRILINRNVVKRVRQIFPYLKYEEDPYCVTVNGRLYWIIDAYTTSRYFPYSEPYTGMVGGDNYVKNSVKVVIDAYDGTTDYFIVDEKDPIAATYKKMYPKLFRDFSEMPEGIREHIRYPNDLFRVQAQIYTRYHMNNEKVFYQQEDMWDIGHEIYGTKEREIRPGYFIAKLPGEKNAEFINSVPFTPRSKQNMTAIMIARNDGSDYGKLVLYRFPKSKTVYGPMQVEAQIDQNPEISQDFALWSQSGSEYSRGNMFVVPVDDSVLYIEPVYLEASNSAIPEVKRVIVVYDGRIAYKSTLGDALKELFGVSGGTVTSEKAKEAEDKKSGGQSGGSGGGAMSTDELAGAAQEEYDKAQDALKDGDWAGYGEHMEKLKEYLDQMNG